MNDEIYWRSNPIQSTICGQRLQGAVVPRLDHPVKHDRLLAIWTELLFVSICHQTTWEMLHERFVEIANTTPDALSPVELRTMSRKAFVELFGEGLDPARQRVNERRAALREIGKRIPAWPPSEVAGAFASGELTLGGPDGFYEWVVNIGPFAEDPLQKKARILVHQLLRYGLIVVKDAKQISPAVDYHLVRLYVRTGRVIPRDDDFLDRLEGETTARVEFWNHLRRAVEEAMWYTASAARLRMDHLNHIEWQIARSFCVRECARCHQSPIESKPVDEAVRLLSCRTEGCPINEVCFGAVDSSLRNVVDPGSARSYF